MLLFNIMRIKVIDFFQFWKIHNSRRSCVEVEVEILCRWAIRSANNSSVISIINKFPVFQSHSI